MSTEQILGLLIEERNKINGAIEALQGTKRRGRPPKSEVNGTATTPVASQNGSVKRSGRRTFTSAQRKQQAERMRAYWAKKRKVAK